MHNVGEIISAYRKKAHYSQSVLVQKLAEEGIHTSTSSICSWEKGKTEPSISTFLHLCRILNIPDCVEEFFGSNPADPMAVLNEEGKAKVRAYIESLIHPVCYAREISPSVVPYAELKKKRRQLRLYDQSVSAGTGDFLDSDQYAVIETDDDRAQYASFAVTIHGDSMEPEFHDHETVFVHSQDTLDNGDIGIFCLNGNAYIKKFRDSKDGIFLVSLNKKYAPVPVRTDDDSFRIFGKVCR